MSKKGVGYAWTGDQLMKLAKVIEPFTEGKEFEVELVCFSFPFSWKFIFH